MTNGQGHTKGQLVPAQLTAAVEALDANKETLAFLAKHAPAISHLPGFENVWAKCQAAVKAAQSCALGEGKL